MSIVDGRERVLGLGRRVERDTSLGRRPFLTPLILSLFLFRSVYTNAVTKANRPLVGDEIDAAGEFLGVSLRRPIDR